MQSIPYNSRDIKYKSIFGSTAAGDSLRFAVVLPRSFKCDRVSFVLHKDGENEEHLPMYWCGMNGDSEEWWDITLPFTESGLYFYHFTYNTAFGSGSIYLRSNGCGDFMAQGREWQQTVFEKGYKTPDWAKGSIMYQIFPDRFNIGKNPPKSFPKDRVLHSSTDEIPVWKPNSEGKVLNNDYYGGTLKGITEKLPYIASLGVNILYLNPIFEAHSNHRYNTADYMKIDPMLGTEADFKKLCLEAKKLSIKVILDGVFSHTGSDSIYFNREKRYGDKGAFNDREGKYKSWYTFNSDGTYKSWWGIDTLPETNEDDESYLEFITGKNGVAQKWLSLGASGFRLDVADELPDKFLDEFCKCVKSNNNDNLIIGEVWEDATNKISYGVRRRYLLGKQLDSVMNYPFASAILTFMRYGVAESFMETVTTVCENYPKEALDCLMNHIGTHDTARILTSLIYDSIEHKPRDVQVNCKLTKEEYKKAKLLLKTASVLQYTLPGFPSLYYGDEAGMEGGGDPFNRGFYPWGKEDKELIEWYRALGKTRCSLSCLKDGEFIPYSAILSCVAYIRKNAKEQIMVIANMNPQEIEYFLPSEFKYKKELLLGKYSQDSIKIPAYGAVIIKA